MKNPKYIYEVELEQITPYVNEIDGEGKDILRPTEFKPRFDKFLIRKYEEAKKEIPKILLLKVNGENKKENEKISSEKKGKSFDYSMTTTSDDLEYKQREPYKKFMTSGGDGYQVRKKNIKLKMSFFSLNLKMIFLLLSVRLSLKCNLLTSHLSISVKLQGKPMVYLGYQPTDRPI